MQFLILHYIVQDMSKFPFFYNCIDMPLDNLLPWYVYLCEYWEPQDILQHYEEEAEVQEDEEEEEEEDYFSTI